MKSIPCPVPSMYIPMTFVKGSSLRYASRSALSISTLFPTLMNLENPTLTSEDQSSRVNRSPLIGT